MPAPVGGPDSPGPLEGRESISASQAGGPAAEVAAFLRFLADYRRQVELEADQLLTQAREQAEALVRQAEAEAQSLREQARREGYQLGLGEGEQAARERVNKEATALLSALRTVVDAAERARHTMVEQAREDILKLSLAIAEKIVRREVSSGPEVALRLLDELLPRWEGVQRLVVRCHPDDALPISQYLENLKPAEGDAFKVEVIPSESISRGGCLLESQFGQLDARLETRFKQVGRQLMEWLSDEA